MNKFLAAIRDARKAHRIPQQKLAALARVSLATVQNLEANRGNPSLSTIQSLLDALALEIEVKPKSVDLETLTQLGVPLLSTHKHVFPILHRSFLVEQLSCLTVWLQGLPPQSREALAMASYLSALRDHYASTWSLLGAGISSWLENYEGTISPKLRRLALRKLEKML